MSIEYDVTIHILKNCYKYIQHWAIPCLQCMKNGWKQPWEFHWVGTTKFFHWPTTSEVLSFV